jgi:hypothetical protein
MTSALPPPVAQPEPAVSAAAFDHSFVVRDVDGQPHSYHLHFHPTSEGQVLMFELIAMVAPPGSALAAALLGGDGLDVDLTAVDWTATGREIQAVLGAKATPEMTHRLLAYTVRDNIPIPSCFDMVYRANYGELLGALWEVIKANRFFSLPGMSLDSIADQIGPKLKSLLQDEKPGSAPSNGA